MKNTKTDPLIASKIIDDFKNTKVSMNFLARKYDLSRSTIRRIIVDADMIPPTQPATNVCRIYNYNKQYFSVIDSYDKAYWIGFLSADGYVQRIGGIPRVLGLKLASKDYNHLVLLLSYLQSTHPIRSCEGGFRISISSTDLVKDLKNYGIIPNKTLSLRWPTNINNDLLPYYLRGYSDGDGCFAANYPRWHLVGNKEFLLGCQDYLVAKLGFNKISLRQSSPNSFTLSYGGRGQIKSFLDFIYQDHLELCLLRKKISGYSSLNK